MKNTNRSPFIYPVYIVQVLNQLMEDSVKNRNGILSKRADIVEILYNQFNNFPITEQVYQMMWVWIIKMLNAGHYDWIKQYWNIANQYCTFKLEYSNKKDEKNKFLEFHIMVGVLLFYKKSYNLLQHIFNFTNTLPAKYPLIPSTFSQIFYIYEELSEKNKRMYLLNYHMSMVFEGAGEENKIEGLLVNYLALLMIRLYDVNDYNITYSNPLDTPATGNNNDFSSQSFNSSNNGNDFSTKIQEYSADAYFGIERSFKNGLSFSASVKGDYYHINDYTKWWVSPQVAITYMKNPNHVFQVDISTSKDYPAYWEIHGAETWLNNYMVIMGNSLLKPSYTYENQLVYIYHQKYMAVLYYNYTDNAIVQLPYQSANSLNLIYQTLNYKYNQMFGMMLRVPFNLGQILQSTVTINGYYTHNKVDNFHNLQINREKFSLYTDLTNSIRLSSKYPIYITLNAAVLTSSLQGIAELSDIWKIDLGFKWTTLKGSADLIVSGGDILNTWSPKLVVNKYNQNLRMDTYDMTRQFKVSFVYRFNSFKPKTYETNKSRFGISK